MSGKSSAKRATRAATLIPCAWLRVALTTPSTCPRSLTTGPPELPGLIAASVCSHEPATALTTP